MKKTKHTYSTEFSHFTRQNASEKNTNWKIASWSESDEEETEITEEAGETEEIEESEEANDDDIEFNTRYIYNSEYDCYFRVESSMNYTKGVRSLLYEKIDGLDIPWTCNHSTEPMPTAGKHIERKEYFNNNDELSGIEFIYEFLIGEEPEAFDPEKPHGGLAGSDSCFDSMSD